MKLSHFSTFFCCLLICVFSGCKRPVAVSIYTPSTVGGWEPVRVEESAAYPKQEPGTRPPVLIGYFPLAVNELQEGWIQLFDGISTYGWSVLDGTGTLSVREREGKRVLFFEQHTVGDAVIAHDCLGFTITHQGYKNHNEVDSGGFSMEYEMLESHQFGKLRIRPGNLPPMQQSDWKDASEACTAQWNDGVLELSGGSGMIESVKEYGDFLLQLEYFTEAGINSGVFFRCIPGENMNGYECQIFNSPPPEDYEKFIGTDTGGLFRRQVGRNVGPEDGKWNHLTIAARGPRFATWVNGIQCANWADTRKEDENPRKGLRLKSGTLQLQGHDPQTRILFRNFRIMELNKTENSGKSEP